MSHRARETFSVPICQYFYPHTRLTWWHLKARNGFNSFPPSHSLSSEKNALHWQTHLSVHRKEENKGGKRDLWHFYDISTRWREFMLIYDAYVPRVYFPLVFYFLSCLKYIILHSSAHPHIWLDTTTMKMPREWGGERESSQ